MDKLGWIVVSNNTKLSGRRGKHSRSSAEQLPWASAWYLRRSHGSFAHSQEQFPESQFDCEFRARRRDTEDRTGEVGIVKEKRVKLVTNQGPANHYVR